MTEVNITLISSKDVIAPTRSGIMIGNAISPIVNVLSNILLASRLRNLYVKMGDKMDIAVIINRKI